LEAELRGFNHLAKKEDENCIYLKNAKCSIYSKRPKACREFSCWSKEERFEEMIETIKSKRKLNKLG
jgi:Fe-S-cluster containining protein